LLSLLPDSVSTPSDIQEAVILTDYAVVTRYPGDYEPVAEQEYQQALSLAESVVLWSESLIGRKV
jgi:hypothetical protein